MSARRDRIDRAAQRAEEQADRARAHLARAVGDVAANERERESLLERSGQLADADLPSSLRSHLAGAGARRLTQLVEDKADLQAAEAVSRAESEAANARLKALERLVRRADAADELRRRRSAASELQDMVVSRVTRDER